MQLDEHPDDVPGLAAPPVPARRGLRRTVGAYVRLTKPRVVELLLVTTVPAMVLAAGGWPSTALVVWVVVGGALAAGGANAINGWFERDRDRLMHRTHGRPLATGELAPGRGLAFGIVLNVVAFALLWRQANLLAAGLTLLASLFYVFVYTVWLKPRTEQNIVIGGAAGAVPVLVGWAAVTGDLAAAPWVLFAVIFLWTPAHFWALAIRYRRDYARAGIPMLPVGRGNAAAARQITAYAAATAVASVLLGLVTDVGPLYVAAATGLGIGFVGAGVWLARAPGAAKALRFFRFSNAYLSLLFAAVALDVLLFA